MLTKTDNDFAEYIESLSNMRLVLIIGTYATRIAEVQILPYDHGTPAEREQYLTQLRELLHLAQDEALSRLAS
jgi:hypothetical protein